MGNADTKNKRLRNTHNLFLAVKADDPETDVTEHFIRRLLTEGLVPTVKTGNKPMATIEDVFAFLYEGKRW